MTCVRLPPRRLLGRGTGLLTLKMLDRTTLLYPQSNFLEHAEDEGRIGRNLQKTYRNVGCADKPYWRCGKRHHERLLRRKRGRSPHGPSAQKRDNAVRRQTQSGASRLGVAE